MDVVVVGSVNRDVSVLAPRLPRPGETITGTGHFFGPGGKGANQAVAVARMGMAVAMVGRVGADEHGETLVRGLEDDNVDVSPIDVDPRAATGIAVITIDDEAENTIVVSPGANMELGPEQIQANRELIAGASVVLAQLEIPTDTVLAAARIATGVFCLNPAPAVPIPDELLRRTDVLVPNRSELGVLAGVEEPRTVREAAEAVARLGREGPTVVTLGREGSLLVTDSGAHVFPAPDVDSVDPTGAGDAFCGALASMLAQGRGIEESIPWAVAAGAVAVTRRGAQTAMPERSAVEALLGG